MNRIDICNSALIEAHQDATISNIDEKSVEAERCKRIYDVTRRELLSMYPWTFAKKYVKLARVKEDVEGFKYAYKYPTEALRINDIYINEEAFKARTFIPFDLSDSKVAMVNGEKCICCDYSAPWVSENIDVESESLFSNNFCRLFYLYLALKISKMAGTKQEVRSEIIGEINEQLSITATVSNREDNEPRDLKNYYVDVRG